MLKIIIFGLVLVAIALSGAVSVAGAETVPSPLQQTQEGVPLNEVMCADDRVLMASPSGSPACVFAESVNMLEQRGFTALGPVQDASANVLNGLLETYTYESDIKVSGHAIERSAVSSPVSYTIDIPR